MKGADDDIKQNSDWMSNKAAERQVVHTLLVDVRSTYALDVLKLEDFTDPAARLVYQMILRTAPEDGMPSIYAVGSMLEGHEVEMTVGALIKTLTGYQILKYICAFEANIEMFPGNIKSLKEYAARRAMQTVGEWIYDAAGVLVNNVANEADTAVKRLDEIASSVRNTKPTSFTIGEITERTVSRLETGELPDLIDTGLSDLNLEIGGFTRGELAILAGRPSMGKTTIALSALRQAAKKQVSSMFFSMEMPAGAVSARLLSDALFNSQTPVEYKKIIRGDINPWDVERIRKVQGDMVDMPVMIDDQSGLTVSEISVRARRYQDLLEGQGKKLDIVCVDHLGFVRASSAYRGQRHLELGEITKGLKAIGKSLDVAVLLLCQLNRDSEKREDRRPGLPDLRGSGEIEEDADLVMFAYRKAYYLEKAKYDDVEKEQKRVEELGVMTKIVELLGLKTRNGPVFSRKFFADMGSNCVRDLG